jgi:predicted GNAT family N-acyltransferase
LVVTKKEISRKTIKNTLEEIKTNYPNSYIEVDSSNYLEDNKNY